MELDIKNLCKILLKKIWIIVIAIVLCAAVGFTYSKFIAKPVYVSSVSMYVNPDKNATNNNNMYTQSMATSARELIQLYGVILKSDTFLNNVSQNVSLGYSASQVRSMIKVDNINDTAMMSITVSANDAATAQKIASTIQNLAPDEIKRVVEAGTVSVMDSASYPTAPSSPNIKTNTLIAGLLGAILSILGILLVYYFDTKVKDEEDLTVKYHLPVLGTIPALEENN